MLQTDFENYLKSLGISSKSHKNYRSDLSHFFGWVILRLKSKGTQIQDLSEVVPFLGNGLGVDYKTFMFEKKVPVKTVNRRLSTLRHFSKFLLTSEITDFDFMENIANLSLTTPKNNLGSHPLIDDFEGFLEAEKVSRNTIKNYLSDIRQFMIWLENNHAQTP
jgi:site-specific recombinase XerD